MLCGDIRSSHELFVISYNTSGSSISLPLSLSWLNTNSKDIRAATLNSLRYKHADDVSKINCFFFFGTCQTAVKTNGSQFNNHIKL